MASDGMSVDPLAVRIQKKALQGPIENQHVTFPIIYQIDQKKNLTYAKVNVFLSNQRDHDVLYEGIF
jgi:hypothetical protein